MYLHGTHTDTQTLVMLSRATNVKTAPIPELQVADTQ